MEEDHVIMWRIWKYPDANPLILIFPFYFFNFYLLTIICYLSNAGYYDQINAFTAERIRNYSQFTNKQVFVVWNINKHVIIWLPVPLKESKSVSLAKTHCIHIPMWPAIGIDLLQRQTSTPLPRLPGYNE